MLEINHTLIDEFRNSWGNSQNKSQIAIEGLEEKISYPDLFFQVGKIAGALRALGVKKNDRVAVAIERSPAQALHILGCMVAGACPCPFEPQLGREEVERRFAITKIKWLLFDNNSSLDQAFEGLVEVKKVNIHTLQGAETFWATDILLDDPGFLLFTSGSSGKPKGVLLSHRGILTNATGIVRSSNISKLDRFLHVMPLHHTNGVNNQLFAPLIAGATICFAPRFSPSHMPDLMEKFQPTVVTGVPTMYSRLLNIEFSKTSLENLRILRCGSAPITEELHKKVESKFGCPLAISYGLSEATCTSTLNPFDKRKLGSVGKVLDGQEVFLDASRGGGSDGSGEICIGGPSLMMGYLDESSNGMPFSPGSILHTGDIGRFDSEGYLYITGRIKEVIIRGGENLSPNLIEEVISAIDGVQAVCVIGKEDFDLGEVPIAFIVKNQSFSGENLTNEILDREILQKLSYIHKPVEYFFVKSLPENSVGKVDRKSLKKMFADKKEF